VLVDALLCCWSKAFHYFDGLARETDGTSGPNRIWEQAAHYQGQAEVSGTMRKWYDFLWKIGPPANLGYICHVYFVSTGE
jgi:hypothetical protein